MELRSKDFHYIFMCTVKFFLR